MQVPRRSALAGATAALAAPALAQTRPVAIVVAYPAGGDTDALARFYAEKLAPRIGRQVVIENRSGASGAVGTVHVAGMPPDGDTLMFAPNTFPIVPHVLRRGANYHPVNDFTPITMTGTSPLLLVASRQSGLRTVADVRAAAVAGRLSSYGSPGSGSPMHILAEMWNRAAGVQMQEIAYRGVAPAINDLLAGVLAIGYVTPGAVTQHIRAGTLIPIAVSERDRSPVLPDVPSFVEAGFPEVIVGAWWGFYGPRGMNPQLTASLGGHFNAILEMPDIRERMAVLGVLPAGGDAARLRDVTQADYDRFGRLVRELNIQTE